MTERSGTFAALIQVNGELDMASADGLCAAARSEADQGAAAVILDLTDCPFLDSTGMAAMIRLNDELSGRDIPMLVVIPPEPPARRRLVALAGLELALVIFESEVDALESLAVDGEPAPPVHRRELRL